MIRITILLMLVSSIAFGQLTPELSRCIDSSIKYNRLLSCLLQSHGSRRNLPRIEKLASYWHLRCVALYKLDGLKPDDNPCCCNPKPPSHE